MHRREENISPSKSNKITGTPLPHLTYFVQTSPNPRQHFSPYANLYYLFYVINLWILHLQSFDYHVRTHIFLKTRLHPIPKSRHICKYEFKKCIPSLDMEYLKPSDHTI